MSEVPHFRSKTSGRLYRITGRTDRGTVTAEYHRPGRGWRTVLYGHRLDQLTVALDGAYPRTATDSTTWEAIAPKLLEQANGFERVAAP